MFLTVKQVAERLQVSQGTIYAAINEGKLKAYRFGNRGRGTLRVTEAALQDYLQASTIEVSLGPATRPHARIILPKRQKPGRLPA